MQQTQQDHLFISGNLQPHVLMEPYHLLLLESLATSIAQKEPSLMRVTSTAILADLEHLVLEVERSGQTGTTYQLSLLLTVLQPTLRSIADLGE